MARPSAATTGLWGRWGLPEDLERRAPCLGLCLVDEDFLSLSVNTWMKNLFRERVLVCCVDGSMYGVVDPLIDGG